MSKMNKDKLYDGDGAADGFHGTEWAASSLN